MKNFNRDDKRPQMYQAVCSDCKRECEVPFRPTGDRPVYCKSCFDKHSNVSASRPGSDDKRKFEAVCAKCGKRCEVPFRPSGDKPVYCQACFSQGGKPVGAGARDQGGSSAKGQFEIINSKLDRILTALSQGGSVLAAPKKTAAAEKVKIAPVKKAKAVKKPAKKKK